MIIAKTTMTTMPERCADIKFILGELRRDPEKYGWVEQETE